MEYWDLIENPTGITYKKLVEVLCTHSDSFYFITRKELKYNKDTLKRFEPYIIEKYKTQKWANTITEGPSATLYLVEANEYTCRLLQELSESLYDWVSPNLPEDLTFIKNNFEWFTCTTHERFGGFSLRSDYYKDLINKIEGIKITRNYDFDN